MIHPIKCAFDIHRLQNKIRSTRIISNKIYEIINIDTEVYVDVNIELFKKSIKAGSAPIATII